MGISQYAKVAIEAAKQAGQIHKKYFQTNLQIEIKDKSYDRLTIADIESEEVIVSTIKKYFPEHNFIAEENKYQKTDSEFTWIIDPLDGTNNFSFNIPIFCASIALAKNGQVILGVIYDVSRDELFYAEKDQGAFLNGVNIKVSRAGKLTESLLITGFYYDRGEKMSEALGKIEQFLFRHVVGLRRFGAAALDLCSVACGRATGFWEFQLSPWDFAAGKILIEEAGGMITGRFGEDIGLEKCFIVASNNKIHKEMLEVLR